MVGNHGFKAIVGAAVCGLAAPIGAFGQDIEAQLQALQAEVAQLRAQQDQDWMNERRAEEIKGLVREVLADAETRASLMEEGITAGHDGKNFFLASPDDAFLMNISGQLQMRYLWNTQNDRSDEDINGFQLRRTKLTFAGHIANPRIGYELTFAADRNSGDIEVEDAIISYDLTDNLEILAGRFKLPFARQELISSKRQLAVDRSSVHEYFTLNRAEQIQLQYSTELFKLAGAFSHGANSGWEDYNEADAEYALTGRVDYKVAGDWGQAKDVRAWDDDFALFLGGAAHFEQSDEDAQGFDANYATYTIDALAKSGPVAGLGAIYFADGDEEWTGAAADDAWGALLEAGYSVTEKFQPFVRWEMLDVDGADNEIQIATLGFNYYVRSHNAKFTADVAWKYAGDAAPGLGSLNDGEFSDSLGFASGVTDDEDQVAVRTQFQLLF